MIKRIFSSAFLKITGILILIMTSFYIGKVVSLYKGFSAEDWYGYYKIIDEAYTDYYECIENGDRGELHFINSDENGVYFDSMDVTCKKELDNTLFATKKQIELGRNKTLIQRGENEFDILE